MTNEERMVRWRLILGSESQERFQQMGICALSDEDIMMDQALAAIYGTDGEAFEVKAGRGPSAPHISRWLGNLRKLFDKETVAIVQNDAIERKGGKVTGSVTAKTTYLINNDITSNSSKNKKAKELQVPILTEEDFMEKYLQ